jgi:hypothetical protein
MPVIPLKQLSYDDANDIRRIIDAINANFRYLDWLINRGNLDTANIKPEIVHVFVPVEPEKNQPVDQYGLNPEYFKFYPNKCWNSSFEVFDPATLKPKYWDTDGVVSADANFDNTHSLKLAPGKYAQQVEVEGEGLADPSWWSWCPETRISFRVKGAGGTVRAQVIQGGVAVPLWIWVKDAKGNRIKSTPAPSLVFDAAPDWPVALRTFAAQTSPTGGKMAMRFENVGSVDVYIDAVTIEPDWTGRWPSFYTHGPKSVAGSDAVVEYKRVPYSQSVLISFSNRYAWPPVVTVGIEYEGAPSSYTMTPHVKLVKQLENGVYWYTGVEITWAGGPSSISGAYTTMIAVCR